MRHFQVLFSAGNLLRMVLQRFDRPPVLTGRHALDELESARKIMDGRKTQRLGDLRDIHTVFADELFGTLDFAVIAVLNHAHTCITVKQALQIGGADHGMLA